MFLPSKFTKTAPVAATPVSTVQLSGIAPAGGGDGGNMVLLTGGTKVCARAFENGEWSALTTGVFLVAPIYRHLKYCYFRDHVQSAWDI